MRRGPEPVHCYAYQDLRKRGVTVGEAWNTSESVHSPWRLSKAPDSPLHYFEILELPALRHGRNSVHRTAGYVTRRFGGLGGRSREASSYPG